MAVSDMFRQEQLGEGLRAVFRHWNDARGDLDMPERRHIDPTEIRRDLRRVWIYEREDDGEFRCRLAGEEINVAYGRSIQGHLARDVIGPKFDDLVRVRWNYALDKSAMYHGYSVGNETEQAIERLCLPLTGKDGAPRFVFGISQYFDSAAPKLYPDSFKYISLDVSFYQIPTFERISDGAPA